MRQSVLIFIWGLLALSLAANIQKSETKDKLSVKVYYTILCRDSIRLMTTTLISGYRAFGRENPYFDLVLLPYGKSNTTVNEDGSYEFSCQFGENDCNGNKVQACGLKYFGELGPDFVECTMGDPNSGANCAQELNLDYSPVETCLATEAEELYFQIGEQTKTIDNLYYVPYVTYDDQFTVEDLHDTFRSFIDMICQKTNNAPEICN